MKVSGALNMDTEEQSENSLRTVALIVLCCGAVKMLHLLGVISVEGECAQVFPESGWVLPAARQGKSLRQSVIQGGVQ